jgi:plastocyanin
MKRTVGLMQRKRGAIAVATTVAAVLVLPAVAGAATKTVYAGSPPGTQALAAKLLGKGVKALGAKNPEINAFSLQRVTINQGDSVKWVGLAANFHTVDLPAKGGEDLPLIVPGSTVTGAIDAAGNPFWFNGHAPSLGFNSQLFAPSGGTTYSGASRIDSGLPISPHSSNTLRVTFTKPGVYRYFCDVHAGMIGYVVVRPKGKPVPTAKQDKTALTKQLTTDIVGAAKLLKVKQPAHHVSLGLSTAQGVELLSIFPTQLSVKAGTVVTFSMSPDSREVHTATFGPTSYLTPLSNAVGSPTPAGQEALYPSSNPALGPIQLNRTSHGNGFANTGALDRDPTTPLPSTERIDFTQPGVYHFQCLIHTFMHGTIIVK